MATELGKAYVQIVPSAQGISGKISSILKPESVSAGKSSGQSLGSNLVGVFKKVVIAAGIGKAISMSLKQGGALEQSIGGVETLFKGSADRVRQYASQSYKTVGVSANQYMENVTSFSASLLQSLGGNTSKAADIANMAMVDMGDNANKMGTNMQDIQNAYQGFAKQNYTMLDNLKLGYGGTKSEMERLLADAQKLTGVKYDINNLSDVYEAIHAIQGELGITGTTAKEAAETLLGSFNSMKAAFTDVLGNLAIGENVKESFAHLAETISTFVFDNLIPMVGEIFKNIPEGMMAFVTTMGPLLMTKGGELIQNLGQGILTGIPQMLTSLGNITQGIATWVQTSLPTLMEKGVQFITSFVKGFVQGSPQMISKFGEILKNIITAITTILPQVIAAGLQIIVALAKALITNGPQIIAAMVKVVASLIAELVKGIPKFLEKGKELAGKIKEGIDNKKEEVKQAIVQVLTGLIQLILAKLSNFLQKGKELAGKIKEGIDNKKQEILTAMSNILQGVVQKITSKFGEFLQKGRELMNKVKTGISNAKSTVATAAGNVINSAKQKISSFASGFISVGRHIISGVATGIKNGASAVVNAARSAAQKALNAAKNFLGIRSPSRVFRDQVGQWIPEGMAVGISGNLDPVKKAVGEMEAIGTDSLTKDIAYNLKTNSFTDQNSFNTTDELKELKPIQVNLSLGGKSFRAFVDSISLEQNKEIELNLAY